VSLPEELVRSLASPLRVAVVGFGEFGSAIGRGFAREGGADVFVFSRASTISAAMLAERAEAAGVTVCATIEEALDGADVVISAVPASAASEVARRCAGCLTKASLFVDVSPQLPEAKDADAVVLEGFGATYADVAIIGTVAADGFRTPMIVCGSGASAWREIATPLGIEVTTIEGPPGSASLVKLLRSIYMKGRDSLILELLLVTRAYGLDDTVVQSIAGAKEQVPFPDLVTRVMCSLAMHAERRADELAKSADIIEAVGLEPLVTRAGVERLQRFARLGLRERFAGDRPAALEDVLAAIDEAYSELPRT
jgi:3-hydroxyisobutyrate dehydrogenase-like beta-hydroxyacid dehydrogenase